MSFLLPQTGGSPAILRLLVRIPVLTPIAAVAALTAYFTQSWWLAALVMALGVLLLITARTLASRRAR